MSNRADRRARAAAGRRAPTSVSTHHKFIKGQARLAVVMNDIRRIQLDAEDKVELLLDSMAVIVHEMAKSEKIGLDILGDVAGRAMNEIMTDKVRGSLIDLKWRGATLETVDDLVMHEIIRRSMIRSDLGLAICLTDRIALIADEARKSGGDVTEAAHAFYNKTLGAEKTRDMRERLVAMNWRGATIETLEDLTVNSVLDNLDRCVQLATQFSALEDVEHDRPIEASEGFERRLTEEYNQTLWSGESAQLMYKIVQGVARDLYEKYKDHAVGATDAAISALTDRVVLTDEWINVEWAPIRTKVLQLGWNGASDETIDRMFMDAVFREIRTMAKQKALGVVVDFLTQPKPSVDPPAPTSSPDLPNGWRAARGPTFYGSTFDRALMRLGTKLWQDTYAKGLSDEATKRLCNEDQNIDPVLGRFAAIWAVHAFQRLTTSHTYAAALMCTDADRESLATIQEQWRAFMVVVPNGMLCTDPLVDHDIPIEFTRILVALYDGRAELGLVDFSGPGGALKLTIGSDASTLAELLTPEDAPIVSYTDNFSRTSTHGVDSQIKRALVMAKRLVAGLLLSMQNAEAVKTRDVAHKSGRPGRDEEEPAHRMVIVGQPIKIDCREAVETFIRKGRGSGGRKSGLPQVQWIVRGHWRQQAYGVGRLGRKTIWIKPHWAGRPDAPILSRPKVVS
jgi:hypothetical protein